MSTESKFDDTMGRAKEATGDLTGDQEMKNEGKKDQAGAKVKDAAGKAKDKASDLVDKAKGDK